MWHSLHHFCGLKDATKELAMAVAAALMLWDCWTFWRRDDLGD
jgi:hypothetical protein